MSEQCQSDTAAAATHLSTGDAVGAFGVEPDVQHWPLMTCQGER
jgi:hypothetical protein